MREAKASEPTLSEIRAQIAGTERQLNVNQTHHAGPGEQRPEIGGQTEILAGASRLIHHLRVAAENLKTAELPDVVRHLLEQADAMEREVRESKQRLAAKMHEGDGHRGEHGPDALRELREEIERLRSEVKELLQKTENR